MSQPMPQVAEIAPAPGGFPGWVESQVRNTPWWLISIAFHLIVLAGMTVVTFKEEIREGNNPPLIIPIAKRSDKIPDLPRPNEPTTSNGFSTADMTRLTASVNDDPVLPDYLEADPSDHNESDNNIDGHTMLGDSKDCLSAEWGNSHGFGRGQGGPGTNIAIGIGGGSGDGGRFGNGTGGRHNFRKVDLAGGPPSGSAAQNAVTYGLWWLARHQKPDGSWSSAGFDANCTGSKCDGPGYSDYDAGETGLAVLAFLGVGFTHLSRERYIDPITKHTVCYGDVVKAGIKWLMANQDAEGCFGGRHGSKYMYNHAIATLAMTEAYGLSNSALFRNSAQAGIDFLNAAQMPYKAWRYVKQDEKNDTSVTGWCVMALKSAEMAELKVSKTAYDGARAWIEECTDATFRTGYTAKGTGKVVVKDRNEDWEDHPSLTAVGMLCRIFISKDAKDPALDGGADSLVADLPAYGGKKTDYYYWYYGSLALYQLDGPDSKRFKVWNEAMTKALLPSQHPQKDGCQFGSWDVGVDRWGFEGGRVYTTALNTLDLEVYYRYASVFGGKRGK